MISVVHVVAVVAVVNVNFVVVVPIVRPIAWPGIEHCYPIASVLEPGVTIVGCERKTDDTKTMLRSKVTAVTVFRNSVAVVTAALLPRAMDRLPISCAMILPGILPYTLLLSASLGALVLSALSLLLVPAVLPLLLHTLILTPALILPLLLLPRLLLLAVLVALLLNTLFLLPILILLPLLLLLDLILALLTALLLRPGLFLRPLLLVRLISLVSLVVLRIGSSNHSQDERQHGRSNDYDFLHGGYLENTELTVTCLHVSVPVVSFTGLLMD